MDRTPVKSSSILSIGHDPQTNTLEVEFANGGIYQYADVTAEHHAALLAAESLGKHFQTHIRGGKFQHSKIER